MPIQRRLQYGLVLLLLAGAVSGCAGDRDAHGGGNDNGNGGGAGTSQGYSDDGYMGITSSYPRIPGRHMALNYTGDARLMRDSIRNVRGVQGVDIRFNGADAYVTLQLPPGTAAREIQTVESQAATVLRFNFPRYVIHVRSRS